MIADGDLYELGTLPQTGFSDLQKTFENLPSDDYAEDRLRSRRYSRYTFKNGVLEVRRNKEFMQSRSINHYLGDVERTYEEIDPILLKNKAFLNMFEAFQTQTNLHPDSIIEAHQLRLHCRAHIKSPAPEGNHQDGFDYISAFMVDTKNVDGGEAMLFDEPDGPPILKKKLDVGEFFILNDRKLFHNAAPLVPTANAEDGHWDVIVLTANNAA